MSTDGMAYHDVVAYCLSKPGAVRDEPWERSVVAKVGGKVFAFLGSADPPNGFSVKATPEDTLSWRQQYPDHIAPGPYLQKTTWSRVLVGLPGGPTPAEIRELIDDSYDLVVARLPKYRRPA